MVFPVKVSPSRMTPPPSSCEDILLASAVAFCSRAEDEAEEREATQPDSAEKASSTCLGVGPSEDDGGGADYKEQGKK